METTILHHKKTRNTLNDEEKFRLTKFLRAKCIDLKTGLWKDGWNEQRVAAEAEKYVRHHVSVSNVIGACRSMGFTTLYRPRTTPPAGKGLTLVMPPEPAPPLPAVTPEAMAYMARGLTLLNEKHDTLNRVVAGLLMRVAHIERETRIASRE